MKFVFVANNSIYNRTVRWFEGGDYGHCAIVDGDRVIEPVWHDGVRVRSLQGLLNDSTYSVLYDIQLPNEQAALDFARAQVGKPYDKWGIVGFAFGRDWQDDSDWYCSELLGTTLDRGGFELEGKHAYARVGVRLMTEFSQWLAGSQKYLLSTLDPQAQAA